MILSGLEIKREYENGRIYISDFNSKRLNPNSYNLRLSNELMIYQKPILDLKKENKTIKITIPENGMIIFPGLYLARTLEKTHTDFYVPQITGRSSIGRLGLSIHRTAAFGDIGFNGYWTLSLNCVYPIKIYPYIEICQIYYFTIQGDYELYKSKKYQNNDRIQPSKMYIDFGKENKGE
jgi:dCTP deaminase